MILRAQRRFEVLIGLTMKITVVCNLIPFTIVGHCQHCGLSCSLVDHCQYDRRTFKSLYPWKVALLRANILYTVPCAVGSLWVPVHHITVYVPLSSMQGPLKQH